MNTAAYSNYKTFWHPDKLQALVRHEITAPVYVRIKPTNRCNHNCFYCSYADEALGVRQTINHTDEIPWSKMQEILHDLADMGVKAVTFSGGGEPLVYPHITEAMKRIIGNNIDLSIITNGQSLEGENAEVLSQARWVRISLDSHMAPLFSKTRGIPEIFFNQLIHNIQTFSSQKDTECEFGVNCVVHHKNARYVYEIAAFLKDLGVDHIKYTARTTIDQLSYHSKFKDAVINQIHKAEKELASDTFKVINKYEDDFTLSMVNERTYSHCPISHLITVIGADSKVYMCHDKAYVKDGAWGDLQAQTFKELWFSDARKNMIETFDAQKSCCHHCVYDDRNILINDFLQSAGTHVNFI